MKPTTKYRFAMLAFTFAGMGAFLSINYFSELIARAKGTREGLGMISLWRFGEKACFATGILFVFIALVLLLFSAMNQSSDGRGEAASLRARRGGGESRR